MDLSKGEAVELRGEWEFFEHKFIVTELMEDVSPDRFVYVPSYMNSTTLEEAAWGSYRVTLRNNLPELTVSVSLKGMPSAYRIFIDGQSVEKSGMVSQNLSALSVNAGASEETYINLQSSSCELVVEVAGQYLPGLSIAPRIQEYGKQKQQYGQYRAFVLLLFGMHLLFVAAYALQLILAPQSGYSRVMLCILLLLLVRGLTADVPFSALPGQYIAGYDLVLIGTYVTQLFMWVILLRIEYGNLVTARSKLCGMTGIAAAVCLAVMLLGAFIGSTAWWLTVDAAVWILLICRLSGCKDDIKIETFLMESGLILLWFGCTAADFSVAGFCPYSYRIYFFLGVIFFDLSVNIIDRCRMNKIQAKALEAVQMESELQQAKLELALHQIKPHFLQNALMSIKVLCRTSPLEAEQAIYDFAVFLRSNMKAMESAAPIPFSGELRTIKGYLHIEQIRFGSRLKILWDIQEENFLIPPLTIQPLVENAVCHGICQKVEGGMVVIASRRGEDEILIEIRDDGVGFDISDIESVEGIGIRNLRLRLNKLLNARLEIISSIGEGCVQIVHIPVDGGSNSENYYSG
ncbi:MAG: sensor histidine kinase [Hominisplanchenecus sp.]